MKKLFTAILVLSLSSYSVGQVCNSNDFNPTGAQKELLNQAFLQPLSVANQYVNVAVDVDHDLYLDLDQDSAKTYQFVYQLLEQSAAPFISQFGVNLNVVDVHMHKTDDGFTSTGRRDLFANYYRNNMGHINRDIAIHLSSENDNEDSFIGGLCQADNGYGVVMNVTENIVAHNSNPTLLNLTHVLGHLFGAVHSNNCFWGAPIDNCAAPEGGCSQLPENSSLNGSIMSQCATKDLLFHPTIANYIGNFSNSCWNVDGSIAQSPAVLYPSNAASNIALSTSLYWNNIEGANQYQLQISTASDFSTLLVDTVVHFPFYNATELSLNTTYFWRTNGINSVGPGPASAAASFSTKNTVIGLLPDTPVLGGPANNSYQPTNPTLSWGLDPSATSYTVEYYDKSNLLINSATTTGNSHVIAEVLDQDDAILWRVKAHNANGNSNFSNFKTFITPFGLTLNSPANNAINVSLDGAVSWEPDAGSAGVSYYLEISENADFSLPVLSESFHEVIIPGSDNEISAPYTYFKPNTTYFWRVRYDVNTIESGWPSYSGSWYGRQFATISSSCIAPTNFSVLIDVENDVNLSWDAIAGAEGYFIEYKKTADVPWTVASTTNNTYQLSGLLENTDFMVRVREFRCDQYTTTTNFNINSCLEPNNVSLSSATDDALNIAWDMVNGSNNYLLQYKEKDDLNWISVVVVGLTYQINSLLPYTEYEVRVADANCRRIGVSNLFTTLQTCLQPQNPTFFPSTDTSVTLAWQPIEGAIAFTIEYKKVAESTWSTVRSTNSSYKLDGLDGNVAYEYRVTMEGCALYSPLSNFSIVVCDPPSNVAAAEITTTSAIINWEPANGGANYVVEYKLQSDSEWPNSLNVTGTTTTLNGLTNGTDYQVRVYEAGCGERSSIVQVTTKACETITNFNESELGPTSISILWFSNQSGVQYDFEYKLTSSATWTVEVVDNPLITLSDLTPGVTYEYRVKISSCDNYSSIKNFNIGGEITALEADKTTAISIYPNPASDWIHIKMHSEKIQQAQLYDVNGKLIWSKVYNALEVQMDLEGIKKGAYILVIQTDQKPYSKFIEIQ